MKPEDVARAVSRGYSRSPMHNHLATRNTCSCCEALAYQGLTEACDFLPGQQATMRTLSARQFSTV